MNEWISFEDDCPEDCDIVIFCTDKGGLGVGTFDGNEWMTYLPLKPLGNVIKWKYLTCELEKPPESEETEGLGE